MNPELASLLLCPECRSPLGTPTDDALPCPSCGRRHAVVDGIPMLAAEPYVESFGRQWNRYDVARPEEDLAVFDRDYRLARDRLTSEKDDREIRQAGWGRGRVVNNPKGLGFTIVDHAILLSAQRQLVQREARPTHGLLCPA